MKQVVNRRIYDTENAEEIHSFSNGLNTQDFGHFSYTLYKSKKGNFFRHIYAGAATVYAKFLPGGTRADNEVIEPLENSEVFDILENEGETEILLRLFPDCMEG